MSSVSSLGLDVSNERLRLSRDIVIVRIDLSASADPVLSIEGAASRPPVP